MSTRWRRRRSLASALVLTAALSSCTPGGVVEPAPSPTVAMIRVGTGPALESRLLAEIAHALLAGAALPVEVVEFGDAAEARRAVEFGEVQFLPGYTGAAWLEELGRADPPSDVTVSYRRVRQLDAVNGVVWLPPAIEVPTALTLPPANATFAFVVAGPPSINADLTTVSQLAARLGAQPEAALCVDPEFAARRDGLEALLRAYAIRFDVTIRSAAPEEVPAAVVGGQCLAGLTTATDGPVWLGGLRPLRDDLGIFPAFVVTLIVPSGLRTQRPDAAAAVQPLLSYLTTERLGRWNARLAAGEALAVVAAEAAAELLALVPAPVEGPSPPPSPSP